MPLYIPMRGLRENRVEEAFKALLCLLLLYIRGCAYIHGDVSF